MHLLALPFAVVIGILLGLLGGGGSIMTVPVLVYVARIDPKVAIAMSLAVIGITSVVGVLGHWRAGNVSIKVALEFGVTAMVGAFAGARLSVFLSGGLQLALLAVVMLLAAASMLRGTPARVAAASADADASPHGPSVAPLTAVGFGVGVITGLVGIGGGFLVVPALVLFGHVPMRRAVGTSLVVISMNCASCFVGHLDHASIPWRFAGLFTAVAVAGILLGTHLARFASQAVLKRGFAVFLLVAGAAILFENRSALSIAHADAGSAAIAR